MVFKNVMPSVLKAQVDLSTVDYRTDTCLLRSANPSDVTIYSGF